MTKAFKKVSTVLVGIQKWLGVVLALAVPFLMFAQIIARSVFHNSLKGSDELVIFFALWLYMIGAANTSQSRTHIECGVLSLYIKKERSIRILALFKSIFSLIVSGWAFYWVTWYFNYSLSTGKTTELLNLPIWIKDMSVFVGIGLMLIYCIIDLILDTSKFIKFFKNKHQETGGAVSE